MTPRQRANDRAIASAVERVYGGKVRQQPEAAFRDQIVQYAHLTGWRVAWFRPVAVRRGDGSFYHETPVGADGKGWPDLVLVRPPRIVFAELKDGYKQPTEDQQIWLRLLLDCGGSDVTAACWRAKDWPEIERTLAR